jgi:predicted transcriptional regulator of viral defense system
MPGPRQDLRRALNALAFEQAGYFTSAQAIDIGYSYQAQKYHVDHGNWVRVDRAMFRLPDWPAKAEDAYVRWALWSAGRGVVSHESALSVHELSDVNPTRIHLTVDSSFGARDDAVVLHVDSLGESEIDRRGAWAVTTPERTLVDVAGADLSQEHIDRAVSDALARGVLTRRRLLRVADGAGDRAALRLERALAAAERAP